MCDPFSIVGGINAAGALYSGFSAAKNSETNAKALENQALNRVQKAKFDIERAETRFQRTQGTAIATGAATGVDIRSFSDVLADNAAEGALEKAAIQYGADRDIENLRFQAAGQRSNAKSQRIGAVFSAAGSFAGSYAKAPAAKGVTVSTPWQTDVNYAYAG